MANGTPADSGEGPEEVTFCKKEEQPTIVSEKERQAIKIVKKHVWWSMGAGIVPIPLMDWAAVAGVQLKMAAELSKLYGVPFEEHRGKAVIASLASFIMPHSIACGTIGSLLKTIPLVGVLVGAPALALLCGAYAWAMGKTFILHFETGGTLLSLNVEEVREYFQAQFGEGCKAATTLGTSEKS